MKPDSLSWLSLACERKLLSLVRLLATPWTIQSKEFSRPEYWSGKPYPSPGDLPNPEIKPRSPTLQADFLPVEPQGKPKNIGVGSLPLLQRIFLSQELNQGLLNYRWILYQLSYQGSPPSTCLCNFISNLSLYNLKTEVEKEASTDPAPRNHCLPLQQARSYKTF